MQLPFDIATQTSLATQPRAMTPSDLPAEEPVLHKVHLRGVDDLSSNDLLTFASTHFPSHAPTVEWIDDTSCNFAYAAPAIAAQALISFTSPTAGDATSLNSLQQRAAKPVPGKDASRLVVRVAVSTDKKRPRAYEASRYYLTHPEDDPKERRRRQGGRENGGRRGRRNRRGSRDDSEEIETFEANMYDDDAPARAARNAGHESKSSFSSESERPRKGGYRGGRGVGRGRQRSASPGREPEANGYRRLRQSPTRRRRGDRPEELFPSGDQRTVGDDMRAFGHAAVGVKTARKELFPERSVENKAKAGSLTKELFPTTSGTLGRLDAADETADLFAHKMATPLVDGADDHDGEGEPEVEEVFALRSDGMAARTQNGNQGFGRIDAVRNDGFSIRGASREKEQGFSIRGSAGQRKTIRELFPDNAGAGAGANEGKELFGGRSGRRNKAADLFG